MRYFRLLLTFLILIPVLFSCNKNLNVNADWKEITVVYGLLNQADTNTYIKITKAFLGPGDAMQFAKVPDSSIFPDKLDVQLQEWDGQTLNKTYVFDTITLHNKQKGDSIFYYPDQLVYFNKTQGQLKDIYSYKLVIRHKKTGAIDSARTSLIHGFSVIHPNPLQPQIDYSPGGSASVDWTLGLGGKRYQLVIRFHYIELYDTGVNSSSYKSLDWIVFNNFQVDDPNSLTNGNGSITLQGDAFYSFIGNNIKILSQSPHVTGRTARAVDYIFSVASDDMNTYMEVTEPSQSIIQERPSFSNIFNGVGLFSSRYIYKIDSLPLGSITVQNLKTNTKTVNRGF